MKTVKLHDYEVDIDSLLVERLIAAQFPQWADLPVKPFQSAGTDNAIYRLGDDLSVRLPRIPDAAIRLAAEITWLPKLAPRLPLVIPTPAVKGLPGENYPFEWAVYQWLDGEAAVAERITDLHQAAADLAHFILALQQVDPAGAPPAGSGRGVPLASRDAQTRAAIESLRGMIDINTVTAAWEAILQAPEWDGTPVWIHGDLQSGNLLAQDGRLSAVIDFGCMGVGDPACDLQVAWNLFSEDTRNLFRAELQVDDAMWSRGRGWALSIGLIALPYYHVTNPALANIARHAIQEVTADYTRRA